MWPEILQQPGNKCHLISIVGNDNNAKILRELCKKTKDLTFDLIVDKTRLLPKNKGLSLVINKF